MTKTVFDNRQLCNVWAQQSQANGHYKIDSIDINGNVKAGCHYVERSEIERLARILKIFP